MRIHPLRNFFVAELVTSDVGSPKGSAALEIMVIWDCTGSI